MNKSDLLKELRARTQAGMKDCHDALRETNDDLEKAVDLIKTKGQNIVSGRVNKVASQGLVMACSVDNKTTAMVEVNCQTDFVARSQDFNQFVQECLSLIAESARDNVPFNVNDVRPTEARNNIVAKTKENCVVRRWWIEQVVPETCKVFHYVHTGNQLGVVLSLQAPSVEASNSIEFEQLGNELAMQVAAMNPLAVDVDRLPPEDVTRQKAIFESQLQELKKPQAQWDKIISGKFNKWHTEVCLLSQESVVTPKTTVAQIVKNIGTKLGGEIQVINFIRCQVGEGLEEEKSDYVAEVAKLSGVPAMPCPTHDKGVCNH